VRFTMPSAPVLLLLSLGTSAAGAAQDFPYPAFDDLSVRGFAQEVLYGTGTGRTARFDDYSPGSYHVRADDLLVRLSTEADTHRLKLKSAIVVGPFGPLWAFDVFAFLQEPACMRVNRVVMPHARITYKATACLPERDVADWLDRFRRVAAPARVNRPPEKACAVLADYSRTITWSHSGGTCYEAENSSRSLDDLRRELGARLQTTYETYPPVPDPAGQR